MDRNYETALELFRQYDAIMARKVRGRATIAELLHAEDLREQAEAKLDMVDYQLAA